MPSVCWVLASPLSSGADEPAHVRRAASVASGELLGEAPAGDPDAAKLTVQVPPAVAALPEPACFAGFPETPASCSTDNARLPSPPGGQDVPVETTSGRHPPAFYALVGVPLAVLGEPLGLYVARVIAALVSAAFLATALTVSLGTPRPRLLAVGVLAAATPMALHLTGVLNPNGLEVAAAICLWTVALALLRPPAGEDTARVPRGRLRGLLAAAGVAAIVLALTRPISALWVVVAVGTAMTVARSGVFAHLVGERRTWLWTAAVAMAGAVCAGWLVVVGDPILPSTIPRPAEPVPFQSALRLTLARTPLHAQEMIGVFGWLDTHLPDLVWMAWPVAALFLPAAALLTRRWWAIVVLAGLTVLAVALPVLLEALRYNQLGLAWQGRYSLPLVAGVPILAGLLATEVRGRTARLLSAFAIPVMAVFGLIQTVAFAVALRRYTVGVDGPMSFVADGSWHPPLPGGVLVVIFAVGQAALMAWLVSSTRWSWSGSAVRAVQDVRS